jgi:PLP dependent protein
VVDLIHGLKASDVKANLARVHERIDQAGREPRAVQILAAVKYLPEPELDELRAGGISLAGENRAQELTEKAAKHPDFTWDFIGQLQSRKVALVLPLVRYIHSLASDSALAQLGKHGNADTKVLIEVNVAAEEAKAGIAPDELGDFIARCPVQVVGLMTMPPYANEPEQNRRHFARLAELAAEHDLTELSMGTSQDYGVAVEEGATIIRLGSTLFAATGA